MNRDKLESLKALYGFKPSPAAPPERPFIGVKVNGTIAYVSGHLPFTGGEQLYKGRIGDNVTIEEGQKSAALSTLNCLDALDQAVGLENVAEIVKVTGYLCCTEAITEHPSIMNAGSQVLVEVFGEAGKHARAALGIHTLPLGASTEVEMIVSLKA
ncbi:RidA family protein [Paenibacillus contaminans]|uniref:RidA family protein n=1 Tax=Paenibacillus contaminans TaxID=450362 RepID=A0A329MG59_9BACL|nr:RidA family protein [Paenibacillus contaminans]RAV17673.1 RidA family protein [Paenibacillus contaminans]